MNHNEDRPDNTGHITGSETYIADLIRGETEEVVWSQISRSPDETIGDRFSDLEQSVARAIARVIQEFIYDNNLSTTFDCDEVVEQIKAVSVFNDELFRSSEFKEQLYEFYKSMLSQVSASKGSATDDELLIDGLSKRELATAIAKAHGISVISDSYPCTSRRGEIFADVPNEPSRGDIIIRWPVTGGVGGVPVTPIVNYAGDVLSALWLVSDMKSIGYALETKESIATGKYTCIFSKIVDGRVVGYSGESRSLPEAISIAYLKTFIFAVNTDVKEKVLSWIKGSRDSVEKYA